MGDSLSYLDNLLFFALYIRTYSVTAVPSCAWQVRETCEALRKESAVPRVVTLALLNHWSNHYSLSCLLVPIFGSANHLNRNF